LRHNLPAAGDPDMMVQMVAAGMGSVFALSFWSMYQQIRKI
jgi:hypothetical protein